MSFSDEVRQELCAALPERQCCRIAQLAGTLRTAASFHLHGHGELHVEVDLGHNVAARRTLELLRAQGAVCEIRRYSADRFGGVQRFLIVLGPDPATRRVLVEAGILSDRGAPLPASAKRVTGRSCCRHAYLRGAFIAAGSVAAPRRPAQLELRAHDLDGAEKLQRLAAADELELKVRDRGDHAEAYAKRLETIEDLLVLIGAHEAAMRLVEADPLARAKEDANRRANADTANLRRQIEATRRQLMAIAALDAAGRLGGLPAGLLDAAALRREHPEATLAELAELAEPALAKPTLAHRLRRIEAIAEDEAGWVPS